MRLTNVEVANTLGLSQSTVSRMRAGHRLASVEVLQAISKHYDVTSEELLTAASKASLGDRGEWIALLDDVFDDGEPDPDEPVLTPEFSTPSP